MILLDTNVLIYASTDQSPFLGWARRIIAAGVSEDGAAVNAVSLAELCVGDAEPETGCRQIEELGHQPARYSRSRGGAVRKGLPGIPGEKARRIRS